MKDVVHFMFRQEALPPDRNLSGRPELFSMLEAQDLRPVISVGAEEALHDEGVESFRLLSEDTVRPLGYVAMDDVTVLVNRLNRSIKKDELEDGIVLPPVLNENETRSLAHRKHKVALEVFAPLNMGIPTTLLETAADIELFLEQHPAPAFIIKPTGGSDGKGVNRVSREEVKGTVVDTEKPHVIQPAYNFTAPFPKSIRPYGTVAQGEFEAASQPGVTKELRVYGFHSPEGTAVYPVGRAIKGNEDHWFFVDPDSVPEHVLQKTQEAIALAAEVSGAVALYGTVDYGYGSVESQADIEPEWQAIELNGKAPYMIGYDRHSQVADHLRQLMTQQIVAIAGKR